MERKGLVKREAISGRANSIVPTDKALELKDRIFLTASKAMNDFFSDYSDSDLETFKRVLKKIQGFA